jgi:hypothetical protein
MQKTALGNPQIKAVPHIDASVRPSVILSDCLPLCHFLLGRMLKVDSDEEPAIASALKVYGLPTIFFMKVRAGGKACIPSAGRDVR